MEHSKVRGFLGNLAKKVVSAAAAATMLFNCLPPLTASAAKEFKTSKKSDQYVSFDKSCLSSKVTRLSEKEFYNPLIRVGNLIESSYNVYVKPGTKMKLSFTIDNVDKIDLLKDKKI